MSTQMTEALAPLKESLAAINQESDLEKEIASMNVLSDEDSQESLNRDETSQDVQEMQEQEDRRSGRRGRSRKIKHDAYRLQQAELRAQQAESRAEEYRQYALQQAHESQSHQQMAHAQYDHSLTIKEEAAKRLLREAKEEGDIDKEIEAQNLLAQFKAERVIYKNSGGNSVTAPNIPPIPYSKSYTPVASSYAEPSYTPHFEDWLEENPWCDPQSNQYDPELANEALHISRELEKGLKFKGQGHVVGTQPFLNAVKTILDQKYSPSEGASVASASRSMVAPVSRGTVLTSYVDGKGVSSNGKSVHLSPEERDMALRMDYGKQLTDEQKYNHYAYYKLNSSRKG